MKHFKFYIFGCILSALCISVNVEANISKETQKEASELTKRGWHTFSQDPSLETQLEESYVAKATFDAELYPAYWVSDGFSDRCDMLSEALAQATADARLNFALQYESESNTTVDAVVSTSPDGKQTTTNQLSDGYSYKTINDPKRNYQYIAYFYNNEILEENTQIGDESTTKRYWKAIMQHCDVLPFAKNAWCILRIWRHTDKGYEVLVRVCYYAPKH